MCKYIHIAQCSVGLERGKVEVQQEEEDTTASSSSSELQEFEAELQATLSALEQQQEPTHTPDEDKVHTHVLYMVSCSILKQEHTSLIIYDYANQEHILAQKARGA